MLWLWTVLAVSLIVLAVSDAEIDTILTRRRPLILSSVQGQQAAKSLCQGAGNASSITAWLTSLQPDGKWPDSQVDYTSGCPAQRANWPATCHWQRTATLAAAWVGPLPGANQLQNNPAALSAVQKSMDWWFQNDFSKPECLDQGGSSSCPCGTSGLWNTNWFSNIIGVPTLVTETCLLLGNTLSKTQQENCSKFALRSYGTFGHNINGLGPITGANTLDIASIGIDIGLLHRNTTILQDAYNRIHTEIAIQNKVKADGIRPDGSFGQHGGILYNGNYGKDYTNDVLKLELATAGTSLEAGDSPKSAFNSLANGYKWMTYLNTVTDTIHWDLSALGRFISFPVADNQATSSIQTNVSQLLDLSTAWHENELASVYHQLTSKSSSANIGGLLGNQAFYTNDYMVHRGDGFVSTVKGYSTRTQNTECVNSQNQKGFHLSDGTFYTHVNGQEYEDIAAAWDWDLIPGTTVDYRATDLSCDKTAFTGIESFVGGASTGTIGIFAMKYTNPSNNQLKWQKSWFFFRGGMQHVVVSNVESKSKSPVFSVLDQKRRNGNVLVDGQSVSSTTNFNKFHSLWHANVGYVFSGSMEGVTLNVSLGKHTGSWSAIGTSKQTDATVDLFEAHLEHSSQTNSIEYTAYPGVSSSDFQKLQSDQHLVTIVNDPSSTAILDTGNNDLMAVYWKAGQINVPLLIAWQGSSTGQLAVPIFKNSVQVSIISDQPILVIVSQARWDVTVSDPSQSLKSVSLKFSASLFGRQATIWGGVGMKTLKFDLPQGGLAGKSITKSLL